MPAGPFLIGGGREPEQLLPTHRPFVAVIGPGAAWHVTRDARARRVTERG
jgi:hypothetical protein